jgi:hypothetical protein
MIEFKIQLEESFVQTLGYKEIEDQLQVLARKAVLKLAAQDILEDLQHIDLENDHEWQLSRNLAWQQEKHRYHVS